MRVTLVVQKLAGLRGGAERIAIELARRLADRGHDVTLVTYEPSREPPGYDVGDVSVVNLFPDAIRRTLRIVPSGGGIDEIESATGRRGNGRWLGRAKWELTHGWFARRLRRWLARHPQDVVVGFLPPAISATALAGEGLGERRPRIVASTHNLPEVDFGPDGRWDPNPVARRTNVRALELADAVTVLQPCFVEQLPTTARPRAVVVPNPVERLAPPSGRQRQPTILGVGRLTDVKRYDVLVEAFARVAGRLPEWDVTIYGEGPERTTLEARVRELGLEGRVRFPGVTDALAEAYDSARILSHPAAFEGFGLSVAEAIVHGLPVIASRHCAGVDALIEDGTTGILVDDATDPIAAFASAIVQLANRGFDADAHARAAEHLAERLDPERIVGLWERVLAG